MSYEEVPANELAAVATYLEMRKPADGDIPPSPLSLRRIENPAPEEYRRLFRAVGAPWLWFSRLIMDHSRLVAILHHPKVELYAVADETGRDSGILELDFREPDSVNWPLSGCFQGCAVRGTVAGSLRKHFAWLGVTVFPASACIPAPWITRPRSQLTGAPVSFPISARSSGFPILACPESYRAIALLRRRCSAPKRRSSRAPTAERRFGRASP